VTDLPSTPHAAIDAIWPDRASYAPAATASIQVALHSQSTARYQLETRLKLLDRDIGSDTVTITVHGGMTELRLPVHLPEQSFRGYGIDLSLLDADGNMVDQASTALDVLDSWTQAPRYGFLSDFAPGDTGAVAHVQALARYHVNVVQFYDWMWRHYELMPPTTEYRDGMGRLMSIGAVRAKVAACQSLGMAAMGYAAVYGAEPEYALKHPDEMLYDATGKPYSIENLFYVMNIHHGNPWRDVILAAMARAVRDVPFDGLHLDQYGFPKDNAFGPGPNPKAYDLAEDFPPFIDDARDAVRRARPGTRVIFNAVDNWPIETVAPTKQDATYIEVWPPYDYYNDLQELILGARKLAPAKQVILAAYLSPLLGARGVALPAAEAAARLASAAIWANGGFHLLLGEDNGALCDPYYPKYAKLEPDFARTMRVYYDFVVRYENVLSDLGLTTVANPGPDESPQIEGHAVTAFGAPGSIWGIQRSMGGMYTVSLINLTSAEDGRWNAPKPPQPTLQGLKVEIPLPGAQPVRSIFCASPDREDGRPQSLVFAAQQREEVQRVAFELPSLQYWTLIVIQLEQ